MTNVRTFFYVVILALNLTTAPEGMAQEPVPDTRTTPPPATSTILARLKQLTSEANRNLDDNDLEDALANVDSALQLAPRDPSLYELRGSIYIKQKLWGRAEKDYQTALQIDPTVSSFKYKLAEIDFLQKAYAPARQGFLALANDASLGELAKYKVFLCDVFDYQESSARRDLDALNQATEKRQAYYFCNAVWALYHNNRQGAGDWIASAARLYSPSEMDLYLSALKKSDALSAPLVTFTTKQGTTYTQAKVFVEENGLRISSPKGWISVPFEQLPTDLSAFPPDLRKQIETKQNPAAISIDEKPLSFSTKSGKKYDRVKWSVENTGLRVLTPDGWITVPFEQLPTDLSSLPADVLAQIAAKQKAAAERALTASRTPPDNPPDNPSATAELTAEIARDIASSQFNLHPPEAKDCHFGTCVAMEGDTVAVGADGATYVYEKNVLKARLCPDVDSTQTGDLVNSISLSHQTLATCTRQGVYVWVAGTGGWKLQGRLPVRNASTVAVDGDHLIVATSGNGTSGNVISFYTRKGETWQPAPRVSDRDSSQRSSDLFGHIVTLKSNEAVIGNPNWNKDAYTNIGPSYSGRIFIEKFDGQKWQEEAQLTSTDPAVPANQFGQSVALADDLIAASSTNRDNIDYAPHHGIVHLFQRTGQSWTKMITIKGPVSSDDAGFGSGPLGLSQHSLVVGDPSVKARSSKVMLDTGTSTDKPGEIKEAGAVYVYENQILQDTLMAPDPVDNLTRTRSPDQFGSSLAIDGDTILVGAPGKDGGTGAVYVWKRQDKRWHLEVTLKGFHKQANFNY